MELSQPFFGQARVITAISRHRDLFLKIRFACYTDPSKKDLTSRFMQFAEAFITDKKRDPHHRPSIKSCFIRIPGTINSKCNQEVRVVQKWDGTRPPIKYILRDFRTWLVSENIKDKREERKIAKYRNSK
jgi:hypothetical protein